MRRTACQATAVLALLCSGACSTAMPTVGAGSTTPHGRRDFAAGASTRIGFGQLEPRRRSLSPRRLPAAGVAPLGAFRVGLPAHYDLGVLVSGTAVRLDTRREWVLGDGNVRPAVLLGPSLILGAAAGTEDVAAQDDPSVFRSGFEIPALYALEAGGLYEGWIGVRLGFDHFAGEVLSTRAVLRSGGVLGMALGFRYLHAGIELTADYEHHVARDGPDRDGLVLVPAFFVRLRL